MGTTNQPPHWVLVFYDPDNSLLETSVRRDANLETRKTKMVSESRPNIEAFMPAISPREEKQRIDATKIILGQLLLKSNLTRVELFGSLPPQLKINEGIQHRILKRLREEDVLLMDSANPKRVTYSLTDKSDAKALIEHDEELSNILWPSPKIPEQLEFPTDPEPLVVQEEEEVQEEQVSSDTVLPVSTEEMLGQVLKLQVAMLESVLKLHNAIEGITKELSELKTLWK